MLASESEYASEPEWLSEWELLLALPQKWERMWDQEWG